MAHEQEHGPQDEEKSMTKRIFVLLVLFGMMIGLQYARAGALTGEGDSLTLASIGFTALFAFTIGELVNLKGLPRVTGWILTGVVLGPSLLLMLKDTLPDAARDLLNIEVWRPIFSQAVVDEMTIFNQLALGLIATLAGLELDLKATLKVGRTLTWTVIFKLLALLVLVGGTFIGIQYLFMSLSFEPGSILASLLKPMALEETNGIIAFAIIFAVLGIGTSPAIVLAVINDLKAKGRFSDLLLAIAVVKDVVVVVSLAIALAVAKSLLSGGGFDPSTLIHVAKEIGLSIVVGLAVGGIIIAYIRFVHAEMLLFVAAMILVVAQVSAVFHLEMLLVFIVAGFLVRNFSPYEHELHHPLEVISLPVFVVFFTIAGAKLDLNATLGVLGIAVALTVARLVALYISGALGAMIGRESKEVRQFAWLAYMPQAGITLGLVLIAGASLPEYNDAIIRPLGMALVALNLIIGPITLGVALKRIGDVPVSGEAGIQVEAGEAEVVGEEGVLEFDGASLEEPLPELPHDAFGERVDDVDLVRALREMVGVVEDSIRESMVYEEEGLTRLFDASLRLLQSEDEEAARRDGVRRFGEQPVDFEHDEEVERLRLAISSVIEGLKKLPVVVPVLLEPSLLDSQDDDTWKIAARRIVRRMTRLLTRRAKFRHVPCRTIGRVAFENPHMRALMAMGDARYRAEASCFEALRRYLDDEVDTQEAISLIQEGRRKGLLAIRRGGLEHLRTGMVTAIGLAERVDTPSVSLAEVSFSAVEPEVRAIHHEVVGRPAIWAGYFNARRDRILLKALLEGVRVEIGVLITERLEGPLHQVDEALVKKSAHISRSLHDLLEDIEGTENCDSSMLRHWLDQTRQTFTEETRNLLKTSTAEFRHHALPHHFTDALIEMIDTAPERLHVIPPWVESELPDKGPLTRVQTIEIPFRAILSRQLIEEFLPELLHHHAEALELVNSVPARLSESIHIAAYAFELNLKGHVDTREPLIEGVTRAIGRVDSVQDELKEQLTQMVSALEHETELALRRVAEACVPEKQNDLSSRRSVFVLAIRWLVERSKVVQRILLGLKNRDHIRALRIRSGVERLSPAGMREYLHENLSAPSSLVLPPRYNRLFSLQSLDDRRLFVAHKDHLESLNKVEAGWRRGERSAVLITGPNGSGKTTLLNMFQLEVGVDRLIRLYDDFSSRKEGVLVALATELNCDPTVDALLAALGREPSAVFISGLEHWFEPTLEGIERFMAFQNLLVRSSDQALWVVSVQWNALEQFERLFDLRSAFSHHIELEALTWEESRRVIEVRHQHSSLKWAFNHRLGWRERLTFWQAEDDEALYFKRLNEVSEGNVRSLIYNHLRTVHWKDEDIETALTTDLEVPFIKQLPADALVILTELLRLGPMERRSLQLLLRSSPEEIDLHLEHLFLAGLVKMGVTDKEITVPRHLHDVLVMELHAIERLTRGMS